MVIHEGSRIALTMSRGNYDAMLDFVARFRWEQSAFSFAFADRKWLWLLRELPLVQHEWF